MSGSTVTAVTEVTFDSHDVRLTIDVSSHEVVVVDSGLVQVHQGWNCLGLSHTARIDTFLIDGEPVNHRTVRAADTGQLETEIAGSLPALNDSDLVQFLVFEAREDKVVPFLIRYQAEFYQDVDGTRFSSEHVGGEIFATIEDRGAYLSTAAYYYPRGAESLARFRLTADIPENWESVSDGNRLSSKVANGRKLQTWENPFKSDGCTFMAAPYVTRSALVDDIEVACYFFEADTGLIDGYLEATSGYIRMYTDLIGGYPYERFTVAENFFPTGYGMPGWTLLGQQVLRLPFIKHTSLGHEVLHNWWGNSVYVDYERGNWCEAATVYGADYRYKLMSSAEDARAYRKDILKQYHSYVHEENDFPIREFQSRTSPNTRTIGYNKAMMVYHMIEQEIGTESFFAAWKQVYTRYREKQISWEEWIDTFEQVSGVDLSRYIPQWIDRSGVPVLDIEVIRPTSVASSASDAVKLRIMEKSGLSFHMYVPIRMSGIDVVWDTSVFLVSADSVFTIPLSEGIKTVEVDPDYHLFRQLYPEAIEPVIAAVLGMPQKVFIADGPTEMVSQFAALGENIVGEVVSVVTGSAPAVSNREIASIVLNPSLLPDDLRKRVVIGSDSVRVGGVSYPAMNHTFVLAGKDWNTQDEYLTILCRDGFSLSRIGQLIPHYGKYSYLVFKGATNVGKGQWEVTDSRLRRSLK
jgi:hypothetical protein